LRQVLSLNEDSSWSWARRSRAEMGLFRHVVAVGTIVHESVFYFHPRVRRVETVQEWLAEVESRAAG